MADAVESFGGDLHIVRTENTETAAQKYHTVAAALTGRKKWDR